MGKMSMPFSEEKECQGCSHSKGYTHFLTFLVNLKAHFIENEIPIWNTIGGLFRYKSVNGFNCHFAGNISMR
jgi:hypothetical protein